MKDSLFFQCTVKNGALNFPIKAIGNKYQKFLNDLLEEAKLEVFIGVSGDEAIDGMSYPEFVLEKV
jgi:hypothetical protein